MRYPARVVTEAEFAVRIRGTLTECADVGSVTGPGRSGAVAAVYASHILGVPFIPFGQKAPGELGRLLIIDTATESGKTLRKAARKYEGVCPMTMAVYSEPPRVTFWYEADKPQRFRHQVREPEGMTRSHGMVDCRGVTRPTDKACRLDQQ